MKYLIPLKSPLILIVMLSASSQLSYANESELNGHELLDKCRAAVEYVENGQKSDDLESVRFCDDYLMGFRESENVKDIYMPGHYFKGYCFPRNGVNNGDLARVVVNYLQNAGNDLDGSAVDLLRRALINGYPCAN